MPAFRTVLFDLDGTLIDSVRLILDSYHHTLRVHGLPPRSDEEWLRGIGTPLRVQFAPWAEPAETMEALIATYREYNLANHDTMVRPYDGVEAMLREVHEAGYRTGLVTSKNRPGALRGLTVTGLAQYVEVLVCADEVLNPKPHPEPVEKAIALLQGEPASTLFVGDSLHDLHSGRGAGGRTAAALWGPFGRAHLAEGEPDYWLERPEDLRAVLKQA